MSRRKKESDNIEIQIREAEVSQALIESLRLKREQVLVEMAVSFLTRRKNNKDK